MKIKIDGKSVNNKVIIEPKKGQLLYSNDGTQSIVEKTEIGEALEHLNEDKIDLADSRMSGIDLRSRLHHAEVSSVLALDSLVSLKVCPIAVLPFTRQKKRLSVSIDGGGRAEIVQIVGGKQEMDAKKGFGERVKGLFGMGGGGQP